MRAVAGWAEVVIRCGWLEVGFLFSRRLKLANALDSLLAAGNSFQMVGVEN